jgi:hypothetical protein
LVRAGPNHTPHRSLDVEAALKNRTQNPQRFLGPIPQDPTARLGPSPVMFSRSTPHLRRESAVLTRTLKF